MKDQSTNVRPFPSRLRAVEDPDNPLTWYGKPLKELSWDQMHAVIVELVMRLRAYEHADKVALASLRQQPRRFTGGGFIFGVLFALITVWIVKST